MRPLCQRLQRRSFNGDGRTIRASLQPLLVSSFGDGRTTVRPYSRYSYRRSGTDARPSVPTAVTRPVVRGRTHDRASLQPLLVPSFGDGRSTERPYNRYSSQGTPTHSEDPGTTLPRKSKLPRGKMGIPHGGIKKFIGTLICFFRSFISFFRTFISRLREEISFARWRFLISSGGDTCNGCRDARSVRPLCQRLQHPWF